MNDNSDHVEQLEKDLAAAKKSIEEFRWEQYDPQQPMNACCDIYTACNTLSFAYYALIVLQGKIVDRDMHRRVLKTLESAGETIPADCVELQRLIGRWIEDVAAIEIECADAQDFDT